eukprot:9172202-Alexandrium_andersonii.AAC.1
MPPRAPDGFAGRGSYAGVPSTGLGSGRAATPTELAMVWHHPDWPGGNRAHLGRAPGPRLMLARAARASAGADGGA